MKVAPEGADLHELRRLAIHAQHRAQRFFAAIELRCDPVMEPGLTATLVQRLQDALWERVELRTDAARRRDEAAPWGFVPRLDAFVGDARRDLESVERRLHEELEAAFGDLGDELLGVDWAFEAFVAGRLATVHPCADTARWLARHGAPNGGNYFLFAEFAFACVQAELEAAFWRALLPTFVRTAHVLSLYPKGVGTRRPDGVEEFGHYEGRWVPTTTLQRLRGEYRRVLDGLDGGEATDVLEDSFGTLLANARTSRRHRIGGDERPILAPVLVPELARDDVCECHLREDPANG